jgi:iron complex outermembrane receptor protein
VVPNSSGALNFLDVEGAIPPGPGDRVTDSMSYYGLAEYDFLSHFTLSIEGRYFDEKYSYIFSPYIYSYFGTTPSPATIYITPDPASTKAEYFTPKGTLRYTPTDDFMAYFTVSKGEKPGGYNTVSIVSSVGNNYGPETLLNYELGSKYRLFDRRLILNGDVFYMQYDHKQESVIVADSQTTTGFASEIQNVGSAVVKGFEGTATAFPIPGLMIAASYTYLDSKYTNYPVQVQGGVTAGVVAPLLKNGCTPNTLIGTQYFCVTNLAGNRLEYTPENSAVVTARYTHPIADQLKGFIEADARYTGNRPTDEYNVRFIPSQTVVNAQLGLEADHWTGLVYVENLFNQDKIQSGFLAGDSFHQGQTALVVTPADPIRAGVRLSYKW